MIAMVGAPSLYTDNGVPAMAWLEEGRGRLRNRAGATCLPVYSPSLHLQTLLSPKRGHRTPQRGPGVPKSCVPLLWVFS